jgi:cyclic dehypoxanthinyl futalosine synthase
MCDPITKLLHNASAGYRLTPEEALSLFTAPLLELGAAADARCRQLHPTPIRTFIIGRNINYSNVCISGCRFCAFFRGVKSRDAYLLTTDQLLEKVAEMVAIGGTEMLLQGGMHPELRLTWFTDLFRAIAAAFPGVQIHALSPTEITHLAQLEALPVQAILERLKDAGLQSIPGGGAEILVDRVRTAISPRKCTVDEWLDVMRQAHGLGLPTTATMMYGHIETFAERIEHLERLRQLQDETGGFLGFIPWPFQPGTTPLGKQVTHLAHENSQQFLRMLAISRLYLDNVPHLQSSWVTQGLRIGQLGLHFGADDLGSTMMEEQVVSAAGTTYRTNAEELARQIADLGFRPAQRTTTYDIVREW